MTIQFKPIEYPYSDEVFEITKAGLFPYVEAVFGWDMSFKNKECETTIKPNGFIGRTMAAKNWATFVLNHTTEHCMYI